MLTVVIGIVKVKALAVLLGPAGVGLMGLYQNVMSFAATLAGCGVANSGVRFIASAADEQLSLELVRRALWLGNLLLGLAGMLAVWAMREPIANWILGDVERATDVGWLGLGVFLSLVAGSQTALLQGLRRIGDFARVRVFSALFGTVAGVAMIGFMGEAGVVWFVVLAPFSGVIVAMYYARALPPVRDHHEWQAIRSQWMAMLKLGVPFMASGLLTLAALIVVRALVTDRLGLEAGGHFQAAWSISMTYIGFVLGAMSTDYYPRLAGVIKDHSKARELVAEQSEMAMLMAGPVLIAMIVFAPWIIQLLYSDAFASASEMLRIQVLGDIIKLASWPMGFILVASGRGGLYLATQGAWSLTYVAVVYLGVDLFGLLAVGAAFPLAYLLYVALAACLAWQLIGYRLSARIAGQILLLLSIGVALVYLAARGGSLYYIVGVCAILVSGLYSLWRLNQVMDLRGWLNARITRGE